MPIYEKKNDGIVISMCLLPHNNFQTADDVHSVGFELLHHSDFQTYVQLLFG